MPTKLIDQIRQLEDLAEGEIAAPEKGLDYTVAASHGGGRLESKKEVVLHDAKESIILPSGKNYTTPCGFDLQVCHRKSRLLKLGSVGSKNRSSTLGRRRV